MITRATASVAGTRVSYRDNGQTDGRRPVLLCMHGLGGNSRSFVHQLDALADSHRVIAWDAPGYGDTELVDPTPDGYADLAVSLMDELEVSRFSVLGHSMGGMVAGALAARHAGRVDALILSCTFVGGQRPEGSALTPAYQSRLDELESLGATEYGHRRAQTMTAPGASPEVVDQVAAIAGAVTATGLENAMQVINCCDNTEALSSLDLPCLIIQGEADQVVSSDQTEMLHALVRGSRLVTLNATGHAPYIEDPDGYSSALQAFLARV